jgi:hypothetical protein
MDGLKKLMEKGKCSVFSVVEGELLQVLKMEEGTYLVIWITPRSLSTIPVEPSLLSKCFLQGSQNHWVISLGAF